MNNKPISKTNMTISIDSDYYEFLKKLTYKISVEEENKVGLSKLVRRALDSYCPFEKDQT